MSMTDKTKGFLFVTLAGLLWGTGFLYIQFVLDGGLSPQEIVSWKLLIGFIFMFAYTRKNDPGALKIDRKGLFLVLILGVVCFSVYNLLMNLTMEKTTIATTVALLYTAPFYVLIISRLLFREPFTRIKVISTIVAVSGVTLTVTGGQLDELAYDSIGIVYGLAMGLVFAITNLFSRHLLVRYKQLTILTYSFGFGFLFSLTFSDLTAAFRLSFDPLLWLNLILMGLVPTALAYGFFTTGLSYKIESSKAAIITTIEVPVSVLGSYLIFSEELNVLKLLGIAMVLFSVYLLNRERQRRLPPNRLQDGS